MRLALYEPDIPQNAGALIRLGACLGVAVDIIEPCGFLFSDRGLKRSGMDYLELAEIVRHASWATFPRGGTRAARSADVEGSDCPTPILHSRRTTSFCWAARARACRRTFTMRADARLRIPLKSGLRSLNVAQAGAHGIGRSACARQRDFRERRRTKQRARAWFEELRDRICAAFEKIEDDHQGTLSHLPPGRFDRKAGTRAPEDGAEAGGGMMA